MKICILGDVHGRAYLALAAVCTWQMISGDRADLLLQVGDMDVFPNASDLDNSAKEFLKLDPSSGEVRRILNPSVSEIEILSKIRSNLATPIFFARGNHEDFKWLNSRKIRADSKTAPIDPFDYFHYVPDGTILTCGNLKIAFLGGIELFMDERGIDRKKYEELKRKPPGSIDILITHEGPIGYTRGYKGDVQGSQLVFELTKTLQPKYLFSGHTELVGPCHIGTTLYLNLGNLVHSVRWEPEKTGLKRGCIAILDTDRGDIEIPDGKWLDRFETPFHLERWYEKYEQKIR